MDLDQQIYPTGSAPRARGTQRIQSNDIYFTRFSPAGAGNTTIPTGWWWKASVQPRGRGEHLDILVRAHGQLGSAPRARGTQVHFLVLGDGRRFSPAGAGNTWPPPCARRSAPVQPRGRGEHRRARTAAVAAPGSAPRARGTPLDGGDVGAALRFSPAGAGNTPPTLTTRTGSSVQPRGRGEHFDAGARDIAGAGSAPRARGTPPAPVRPLYGRRFSPAGAGNTWSTPWICCPRPVQPRGRGEHSTRSRLGLSTTGSAPRARGTHSKG